MIDNVFKILAYLRTAEWVWGHISKTKLSPMTCIIIFVLVMCPCVFMQIQQKQSTLMSFVTDKNIETILDLEIPNLDKPVKLHYQKREENVTRSPK